VFVCVDRRGRAPTYIYTHAHSHPHTYTRTYLWQCVGASRGAELALFVPEGVGSTHELDREVQEAPVCVCMCMCVCVYICVCMVMRTYTNTYKHTHKYASHTYTPTPTHIYTQTHTQTHLPMARSEQNSNFPSDLGKNDTFTSVGVLGYSLPILQGGGMDMTRRHSHEHTCIHTYTWAHIQPPYINTSPHTYIHTYSHIHTHTPGFHAKVRHTFEFVRQRQRIALVLEGEHHV
jgi:hypothetical protein